MPADKASIGHDTAPSIATVRRPTGWQVGRGLALMRLERVRQRVADDWHGQRHLLFGGVLLIITSLVVIAFYRNHPGVEFYDDSLSYITPAERILNHGKLIDAQRLPGYPLLMAAVFLLTGNYNYTALAFVQACIFVLATIEVYALTYLVLRRSWVAFCVAALVGTNTFLLGYVKELVSDGLALWATVTLALAVVAFVRSPRRLTLWWVAFSALVLLMSRAEWIYLPLPLFAYLLAVAAWRGRFRRLLPHAVAAVAMLLAVLGVYILANGAVNGYRGVSDIQNVNLLGKVMQYHMQDLAPPKYAAISRRVDAYMAHGGDEPWGLIDHDAALNANFVALAGEYGMSIIVSHPVEFVWHTLPVLITSSSKSYAASHISLAGPYVTTLARLQRVSDVVFRSLELFLAFALIWVLLLARRIRAPSETAQAMGGVLVLALYALVLTSVGTYSDYARIHVEFDPLLIIVIWGSALVATQRLPALFAAIRRVWMARRIV